MITIGQGILLGATLHVLGQLAVYALLYGVAIFAQTIESKPLEVAGYEKLPEIRAAFPKVARGLALQLLKLLFLTVVLHAFGVVGP